MIAGPGKGEVALRSGVRTKMQTTDDMMKL